MKTLEHFFEYPKSDLAGSITDYMLRNIIKRDIKLAEQAKNNLEESNLQENKQLDISENIK